MTELSLVLGLSAGALLTAFALARWVLSLDSGDMEARRLLSAVQRAADALHWRQIRRAGLLTLTLVVLTFAAGPIKGVDVAEFGGWLALGVVAGALVSLGIAQLCLQLATRSAARAASAMHGPVSHAVSVGLRAGAAVALLAEASSLILATGALLPFALMDASTTAPEALEHVKLLCAGLGFGCLAPTLMAQVNGGALYCAGQTGRREPLLHTPGFSYQLDVKNPTMVLDVVSAHVGRTAVRVQSAFCVSLLGNTTALASALLLLRANSGLERPLMVLTLPLMIRATGILAGGIAALTTRTDDTEDVLVALFRGHVSSAVLSLAGLFGATLWVLGEGEQLQFFLVGAVAVIANLVVSFGARLNVERRAARLRELAESTKQSPPLGLVQSVANGLRHGSWPLLSLLVCTAGGWYLGIDANAAVGPPLSVSLALSGFLAGGCYACTLLVYDAIIDSGCGLASLDESHQRPDFQGRVSSLSTSALAAGGVAQSYFAAALGLVGVSVAATIWQTVGTPSLAVSGPATIMMLLGGFTGLILVFTHCGSVLRHIVGNALTLKLELQRQLRGFTRDAEGMSVLPTDFKPRYRDYLEKVGTGALARAGLICAPLLLLPPALALLGGVFTDPHTGGISLGSASIAFVAASTIAGLSLSVVADGTSASWSAAVRTSRPRPAAQSATTNLLDTTIDFIGAAASSARLTIAVAAATGLFIAAILF